jgi:very-short-patch-repair endonuclease
MGKGLDATIAARATRQLGLITRRQLLALGLSAPAISYRLEAGRLRRVHPAVYALAGFPSTWDQDLLAALMAAREHAAITHFAAGTLWHLEAVTAECPHVLVVHRRKLELEGVVVHRTRSVARGDIVRHGLLRVTSPARTLIDLATVLAADPLEDALDDALRRRLVSVTRLSARIETRNGIAGMGTLRRLLRERSTERESGSGLENRFLRTFLKAGLPRPVRQYEVRNREGRFIARLDFAYPQARLAIEIDGYASHSGRKRWERDLARQNRLIVEGWRFLRFSRRDADQSSDLFATIRGALDGGGES